MTMPEASDRESLEQVQEHWHRDVVRQVRDEPNGLAGQLGDTQRIVVHDREVRARLHHADGVRQLRREPPVDLDGGDVGARWSRPSVSEPRPGPISSTVSPGCTPAAGTMRRTVLPSCTKFLAELLGGRDVEQSGEVADLGGAEQARGAVGAVGLVPMRVHDLFPRTVSMLGQVHARRGRGAPRHVRSRRAGCREPVAPRPVRAHGVLGDLRAELVEVGVEHLAMNRIVSAQVRRVGPSARGTGVRYGASVSTRIRSSGTARSASRRLPAFLNVEVAGEGAVPRVAREPREVPVAREVVEHRALGRTHPA